MTSPFEYGGTVEGPAFCNRKKELADLTAAAASGERLFVYSERRLGKTSLVQTVLRDLSKKHYASAYIDLWPTDGEASFITATAPALTEAMSTTTGQFIEVAKQLFSRLTPSVTTDADGKPKVTFGLAAGARPGRELEEVLAAPAKIAESGKRKVVVVFDEVQQIAEYEDDMVERRLRSIIQKHRHVSYLFLGALSRRGTVSFRPDRREALDSLRGRQVPGRRKNSLRSNGPGDLRIDPWPPVLHSAPLPRTLGALRTGKGDNSPSDPGSCRYLAGPRKLRLRRALGILGTEPKTVVERTRLGA